MPVQHIKLGRFYVELYEKGKHPYRHEQGGINGWNRLGQRWYRLHDNSANATLFQHRRSARYHLETMGAIHGQSLGEVRGIVQMNVPDLVFTIEPIGEESTPPAPVSLAPAPLFDKPILEVMVREETIDKVPFTLYVFPANAGKVGDPYSCEVAGRDGSASASVQYVSRSTKPHPCKELMGQDSYIKKLGRDYTVVLVDRFTPAHLEARKKACKR